MTPCRYFEDYGGGRPGRVLCAEPATWVLWPWGSGSVPITLCARHRFAADRRFPTSDPGWAKLP